MSRRSNGRQAASWVPLLDVEPHLADALLELLDLEEIAAYAAPVAEHRALTELPARIVDRPLDRLYVDGGDAARARSVTEVALARLRAEWAEHTGAEDAGGQRGEPAAPPVRQPSQAAGDVGGPVSRHEGEPTVDEDVWAQIVAAYDAPSADPVARWPVSEDVADRGDADDDGPSPIRDDESSARAPGKSGRGRLLRRPGAARRSPEPHPDGHFVPPPPPPLPRGDAVTRAAWAGLLGSPVLLLVTTVLGYHLGTWSAVLAVVAFVGGFVTLVVRMKDRPPNDLGGDDGAVV